MCRSILSHCLQHIDGGIHDQLEHYNSTFIILLKLTTISLIFTKVNRDVNKRQHPVPLRPFLPQIHAFARHNHENILHPILRCADLSLSMPNHLLNA